MVIYKLSYSSQKTTLKVLSLAFNVPHIGVLYFLQGRNSAMTNVHKNIILILLGSFFCYVFVWLSGVAASAPVPEFPAMYNDFATYYYPNFLIAFLSGILALIIMLIVRKAFIVFTKGNLFYFALPMVIIITSLHIFMNFAIVPLLFSAVPTFIVAMFCITSTTVGVISHLTNEPSNHSAQSIPNQSAPNI